MDFFDVPYSVVEVNPLTKKEIAFSKDYRKVPIVQMRGDTLTDSPLIIEALLQRLGETSAVPASDLEAFASPEARRWAEWADKQLAVLLFPNITRNFSESYQAFGYVWSVPTFGLADKAANQVLGATAMWAAQGKLKKKYGIDDERAALFAALTKWSAALDGGDGGDGGGQPFAGGDRPHLGDVAVFGCIHAIHGLDTHADVLRGAGLEGWYGRMQRVLGYDVSDGDGGRGGCRGLKEEAAAA
ncbi:unnamed protein product [Phaeothamnion confervicola]